MILKNVKSLRVKIFVLLCLCMGGVFLVSEKNARFEPIPPYAGRHGGNLLQEAFKEVNDLDAQTQMTQRTQSALEDIFAKERLAGEVFDVPLDDLTFDGESDGIVLKSAKNIHEEKSVHLEDGLKKQNYDKDAEKTGHATTQGKNTHEKEGKGTHGGCQDQTKKIAEVAKNATTHENGLAKNHNAVHINIQTHPFGQNGQAPHGATRANEKDYNGLLEKIEKLLQEKVAQRAQYIASQHNAPSVPTVHIVHTSDTQMQQKGVKKLLANAVEDLEERLKTALKGKLKESVKVLKSEMSDLHDKMSHEVRKTISDETKKAMTHEIYRAATQHSQTLQTQAHVALPASVAQPIIIKVDTAPSKRRR